MSSNTFFFFLFFVYLLCICITLHSFEADFFFPIQMTRCHSAVVFIHTKAKLRYFLNLCCVVRIRAFSLLLLLRFWFGVRLAYKCKEIHTTAIIWLKSNKVVFSIYSHQCRDRATSSSCTCRSVYLWNLVWYTQKSLIRLHLFGQRAATMWFSIISFFFIFNRIHFHFCVYGQVHTLRMLSQSSAHYFFSYISVSSLSLIVNILIIIDSIRYVLVCGYLSLRFPFISIQ